MSLGAFLPLTLLALAFLNHSPPPQAEDLEVEPGILVVADRSLKDPRFARTVILISRYDEEGTLGLMLNRRTDVALSRILRRWKEADNRTDPVYLGGPVETAGILALSRSSQSTDGAFEVFAGVQLVYDASLIRARLAARAPSSQFRVYAGYTGWGPEQLEDELESGDWHLLRATPDIVFDPDPDTLWNRLSQLTETRIATLPSVSAMPATPAAPR